ncbi:MAG: sodium-dependent transporter [Tissierellia bacterium]|nr:sodium-dependent transporter [Tissierellia bacterium]
MTGNKRESWGSRFAFIMAAAGFAIGLGNMWRFPYLVGTQGGGAFVLVYLVICLLIGIPLFTMEITLGRKAQSNPVTGMRKIAGKGTPWVSFGWFGVIAAFFILTYYIQIMGWLAAYIVKMLTGELSGLAAGGYETAFNAFTANTMQLALFTIICTVIVGFISAKGIENGIEKVCNVLMPTLFVMLIILLIRSVTLPGAMEGVKWYMNVDFSKINGQTFLNALGQAFFSIGIASGGGFIYGSYLNKDTNVPGDAIMVVAADTGAALLTGFVMFPAIFALGLEPGQGSQLLFVTMSNLFNILPGGKFFGTLFFLLVFFAALLSAIGYFEPIVSTVSELGKMSRKKAVWISLAVIFVVGFPTIMAHGPWADKSIFGMNFFDFADFLSGNILMPLGAIALSLYTAFKWKFVNFKEEANVSAGAYRVMNWWKPFVMFIIPIALIIIFIKGVFF